MSVAAADLTVAGLLREAGDRLDAAGVEQPRRDARLLLAAALDCGVGTVIAAPERVLEPESAARYRAMIEDRARRKPVSRILGRREFWSLPFAVGEATLDPRPDSETVVEAVLATVADRTAALRLLDLGTGTGCLLLALLRELPQATGVGVDASAAAVEVARANAAALGLAERAELRVQDWDDGLAGRFDVVVCNPPYVSDSALAELTPEVRDWEPRGALVAGADGLDAYRVLAPQLPALLAPGGVAAFEVGAGQAEAVAGLFRAAGLQTRAPVCDLAGVARCVVAADGPA